MNDRLSEPPNLRGQSPLRLGVVLWTGVALAAGLLAGVGCYQDATTTVARQPASELEKRNTGEVLFTSVASTLSDLPRYVNLKVRPPIVVLDSTNSSDRKTVMAVIDADPGNPAAAGQFNYLHVVSGNSRFESLPQGVRPGDQVRYYNQTDAFGKQYYVESEVLRVIHENGMLLASMFPEPILDPYRMQIWRYSDEKLQDIERRFSSYIRGRAAPVGWEPSPDETVLNQVVDRLNQWIRRAQLPDEWRSDPLVETLSDDLRALLVDASLADSIFKREDSRYLQEAVWLRDISVWARGDSLDPVERATRLFDWTVRNIQLETDESLGQVAYRPWHTLLFGRGTAEQRAWVFALLCRQQGLDVVMFAPPDTDSPTLSQPPLAALWSDGDFYLFDPLIGLPIPAEPAEDGKPAGVATLAQVLADDALLRRLDLDAEHPYRLGASDLRGAVALIEASPLALSRRMRLVESHLVGDQKIALTVDATALAESVVESQQVAEARIWDYPYRTIAAGLAAEAEPRKAAVKDLRIMVWRPGLWKARVLHLQGTFDGEESAKKYYRSARPSKVRIEEARIHPAEKVFLEEAKMHASYWLGLLLYEQQHYDNAADYFDRFTLQATPDGPWTSGARYNLARAYEAQGATDKAIALYDVDTSPQSHGNRIRARRLREAAP